MSNFLYGDLNLNKIAERMDTNRKDITEREIQYKKRLLEDFSIYQGKITNVKSRVEAQRKLFSDKFNLPLPPILSPSHQMVNYSVFGNDLHHAERPDLNATRQGLFD